MRLPTLQHRCALSISWVAISCPHKAFSPGISLELVELASGFRTRCRLDGCLCFQPAWACYRLGSGFADAKARFY